MKIEPEELARKFHETYEALAPSFSYETREASRKPWEEVPESNRNLMIAVCRIIQGDLEQQDPAAAIRDYIGRAVNFNDQDLVYDRNTWQRRLGVLITFVEEACRRDEPLDHDTLLAGIYRVVNTEPRIGTVTEPYADIAALSTRVTLEGALAAGLVRPGPNAPPWMKTDDEEAPPE